MSSHHVVKEGQEPALLILQADALSHVHITPLLEWSPTIIVAADALAEVMEFEIKIDGVVFSSEQREEISSMIQEQEPVALIEKKEQENTFWSSLQYLLARGHSAVNILTSNSTIQQEEIKNLFSEKPLAFNVVLLNSYTKSALCRPGKFVKWYPAAEKIAIEPALQKLRISTTGFTENLQQALIHKKTEVETAANGIITVNGDSLWWLIEQLE